MTLVSGAVYTFIIALTIGGETEVIKQEETTGRDACVFMMGTVAQGASAAGEVGSVVTPLGVDEDNDPYLQFSLTGEDGAVVTLACIDTTVKA